MTLPTCGLVLTPQRLVAVVLRPGGEARRLVRAALTDDARYGLVEYLSATGAEIVVTDALARADPTDRSAARAALVVWVTPDALVTAITRAAAVTAPRASRPCSLGCPRSLSCAPSSADSPSPASPGRCHSCDHVHHAAARPSRTGVADTNQPVCESINQRERQHWGSEDPARYLRGARRHDPRQVLDRSPASLRRLELFLCLPVGSIDRS